jgi:hypothetical protein
MYRPSLGIDGLETLTDLRLEIRGEPFAVDGPYELVSSRPESRRFGDSDRLGVARTHTDDGILESRNHRPRPDRYFRGIAVDGTGKYGTVIQPAFVVDPHRVAYSRLRHGGPFRLSVL